MTQTCSRCPAQTSKAPGVHPGLQPQSLRLGGDVPSPPSPLLREKYFALIRQLPKRLFHFHLWTFVVLIDDARCFRHVGAVDYPAVSDIESWVKERRPDLGIEVAMDCIRIAPKSV